MDEKLRQLEREARTGDPLAIDKLKRARQRAGISVREKYLPHEINEYGDVKNIKEGWVQIPRMQARNAPEKHTILLRWEGTRRWPNPIKEAIVPEDWWEEKKALLAGKEQRAEELRLAKILKVSSRRLRNRLKVKPKLFKWLQKRLAVREARLKAGEERIRDAQRAVENQIREAENKLRNEVRKAEKEARNQAQKEKLTLKEAQLSAFLNILNREVSDKDILDGLEQRLRNRSSIQWKVSRSNSRKTICIEGESPTNKQELEQLLGLEIKLNNKLRINWNLDTILEYLDRTAGKKPTVIGNQPIL